jgi:TDG/mug DNA glycosylase family protein
MDTEKTLPDYLRPDLPLVFIGINPGYYSAQVGHYYARPGNLFWWALSRSGLVDKPVFAENDADLLNYGIGLTDVVKRPTHSSGDLRQDEFDAGVQVLMKKLDRYKPRVACFVGILGATAFLGRAVKPGPLSEQIGRTRLFAIPSPSRRNAHYGQDKILGYFQQLAAYIQSLTALSS